jgi:hypothetical protein
MFWFVDLYIEMETCNLVSVRDASAQHKCTVQMCGSGVRRTITGTLYRAQPPVHHHHSSFQRCQPYLAIPLLARAPDERAAGGEKSVASCQRPNDASNGTRTQKPMVVHSIKIPGFRAGIGVKGS